MTPAQHAEAFAGLNSIYAKGFAEGERQCMHDRRWRAPLQRAKPEETDYEAGWNAGYFPRSLVWALRTQPAVHHSETERNSE